MAPAKIMMMIEGEEGPDSPFPWTDDDLDPLMK